MWYNEEFLAPFFLNHYRWVDRIHIILDADTNDRTELIARRYPNVQIHQFRFPDMMDDILKSTVISQTYRSLDDADYVIVVDSDEFIFPWDLTQSVPGHLAETGKDVYFVNLWQIYKHESDPPLDPSIPVYLQRRHGDPDMESVENIGYLKPIIVRGGLNLFWGIGNHYIVHNGIKMEWASRDQAGHMQLDVAQEKAEMLQGAHWRLVDLDQTIKRRITDRKQRQSRVNLERGLTAHYHQVTEEDIIREYEAHKHDPVVILGIQTPDHSLADIAQLESAKLFFDQAVAFAGEGNHADAQALYRGCLRIMPDCHDARLNLAWSLGCSGDFKAAAGELLLLVQQAPDHRQARALLGSSLLKQGLAQQALEQLTLAHQLQPDDIGVSRTISQALYALQRYDEAREWIERVLALQPEDFASLSVLASVERTENPQRALSLYRKLAELKPDDHLTRFFHATLLLSLGRFSEGWREFEQRIPTLKMSDDILALPRWHGQPLNGKSIVLVAEQGHGDALQFIRYATLVARLGGRVMVLCHNDQIRPLLATVEGVETAVIPNQPLPFLPDYHCPLMSLPFELGTVLETIPRMPGYLHPEPEKKEQWQRRLKGYPGLKVGIVWAGNRAQADNAKRSVPFGELKALFGIPGVSFFSLQVGPDALKHLLNGADMPLIDWSDELRDFSDTAALVSCIDMVISICSAVTHLSGGIGIPTWVLLQYDADWRWLRDRDDTPWYPSVRLFRQTRPGDWRSVLSRVRESLQGLAQSGSLTTIDTGVELICPSASLSSSELYRRGVELFNAGDQQGAEECFRGAMQEDDRSCDPLNGLATILDLRGEHEKAVEMYRQALLISPDNTLVLFNLANTLRKTGSSEEAESLYRRAIQLQPDFYQAWSGLGNLLLQGERAGEAEKALLKSIESQPAQPDALCDLGVLAAREGQPSRAEEWFKRALALDAGHPAALNHLGMLLMRLNRLDEAESHLRKALAAKPDYWLALNNLGVLLHWAGRLDESEECHRRFIAAHPENGTPHFNLALALLSHGKFAEGWVEYEYRFIKENPVPVRHAGLPRWRGEDLRGKTILIHAEQGYGDTIQFGRYLPLLVERGARVILECQDRIIAPLFEGFPGIGRVITRDEPPPQTDLQLPLMSLPLVLGEAAWREPVSVQYLKPAPARISKWREQLMRLSGLRVGLVWSGRRGQDNNHNRMIPPEVFARLAGVAGVSFVNLLVGVEDSEADRALACLKMYDVRKELASFADTAAVLDALDLLISVDTATPHLAGAMGKEAWVMIPYNADWRWTFGLPDCPLYPSVRLYRQKRPFAWEEVIDDVCRDLAQRVERSKPAADTMLQQAREKRDRFRWREALDSYRQVLESSPLHKEALFGVGACLQMLNRSEEAVSWYDNAAALLPDEAVFHLNRALALLTIGRYREGWQELQWRKRLINAELPPMPFLTPELLARGIAGKRLLIHTEQGFGDTIHAIRYARLLAEKGMHVHVSAPPELVRLLEACPGVSRVIPHGELLPNCDFQTLMMDLPWLFDTDLETIPNQTPYIGVADEIVAGWRQRFAATDAKKVGLVWKCGGGGRLNRELRSLEFDQLVPLLEIPGTEYFSLQVGKDSLDPSMFRRYGNLHDPTPEIQDFADTAALISLLDHVVTIDSSVAHLAGALGKPVSLLLPSFREWRWADRDGYALWYPAVRIVAQEKSGDGWDEVVQKVKNGIARLHSIDSIAAATAVRACRLCQSPARLFSSEVRPFYICPTCALIFSDNPLSVRQSEKHYQSQYDIEFDDRKYVQKILRLISNADEVRRILDYGSGSGRLSQAFRDQGYIIDSYEPMCDGEFISEHYPHHYDLIIVNEVIEHISDLRKAFDDLHRACNKGGTVFIGTLMTDTLINDPGHFEERFRAWWYKDDLTHVSFFCLKTFEYVCSLEERYEFSIAGIGPSGVLLRKA